MYEFNSQILDRGSFDASFPQDVVKNEPMFFNASLTYAYDKGGAITRAFLEALPTDWLNANPVLDSRVHMLMPKWYPCIPGYHHDDVPRGPNGQPDYDTPSYRSEHLMGLVNGDICPTIFVVGRHTLPKVEEGIIYNKWHDIVSREVRDGKLCTVEAQSGRLIQFDWQSMHTGQRAKVGGWRWFVRLSRNTNRQNHMTNELRRQVQVYLDPMTEGW